MFQDKLKVLPGFQASRCNNKVKMDSPKVVDTVDIEDIGSEGAVLEIKQIPILRR